MPYCEKCRALCEESACPVCGNRKLRQPEGDDPVLLTEEGYIRANMLEPLLEQAEIPYTKLGELGSGIAAMIGYTIDNYRFYVPYAALEPARDVLKVLEGDDEENFERDALEEEAALDGDPGDDEQGQKEHPEN